MKKILEMKQIYKAFPGVVAVDNVNLDLYSGEVLALVGENGAGKSTLMKILSGMYKADNGNIVIEEKVFKNYSTKEALELGVSIIYQELSYLADMTISENIFLGRVPVKGMVKKIDYRTMNEKASEVMSEVGLGHRSPTDLVSELSVAEKQLVEIAKAISKNVKILVMDEPTSALNENEIQRLFELIKKIKAQGIGIIYISHRMEEIFRIADRVEIMRDGKHITQMQVKDTNTDEIISYMVGREIKNMYPQMDHKIGNVVFEVCDMQTDFLKNVNFNVRKGEVVGLFGLMGSGRSEVCSCIIGTKKIKKGTIFINGKNYFPKSPLNAINNGIGYVPAERKTEGVNLIASVKDNITLSNLKKIVRWGKLDLKYEKNLAKKWVQKLGVKTPSIMTNIESLSGGNQQKIVIAKCLNTDPNFLILNEPTHGIDVGAKVEIYNLINKFCKEGRAVLIISSELPEIMALSDRIFVLSEGQVTGEVNKTEYTQERLLKYAIGEH